SPRVSPTWPSPSATLATCRWQGGGSPAGRPPSVCTAPATSRSTCATTTRSESPTRSSRSATSVTSRWRGTGTVTASTRLACSALPAPRSTSARRTPRNRAQSPCPTGRVVMLPSSATGPGRVTTPSAWSAEHDDSLRAVHDPRPHGEPHPARAPREVQALGARVGVVAAEPAGDHGDLQRRVQVLPEGAGASRQPQRREGVRLLPALRTAALELPRQRNERRYGRASEQRQPHQEGLLPPRGPGGGQRRIVG